MNILEEKKLETVVVELVKESNDRFKQWAKEAKNDWVVNNVITFLQSFENATTLLGLKKNQVIESGHVTDLIAKLAPAEPATKHKSA